MVIFLTVVVGGAWLGMRHVQQRTRADVGKSLEVVAATTREPLTACPMPNSSTVRAAKPLSWI